MEKHCKTCSFCIRRLMQDNRDVWYAQVMFAAIRHSICSGYPENLESNISFFEKVLAE